MDREKLLDVADRLCGHLASLPRRVPGGDPLESRLALLEQWLRAAEGGARDLLVSLHPQTGERGKPKGA